MSEWQSMKTAPKTGVMIDLFAGRRRTNCHWEAEWKEWSRAGYIVYDPTHWMPIPKPPTGKDTV